MAGAGAGRLLSNREGGPGVLQPPGTSLTPPPGKRSLNIDHARIKCPSLQTLKTMLFLSGVEAGGGAGSSVVGAAARPRRRAGYF